MRKRVIIGIGLLLAAWVSEAWALSPPRVYNYAGTWVAHKGDMVSVLKLGADWTFIYQEFTPQGMRRASGRIYQEKHGLGLDSRSLPARAFLRYRATTRDLLDNYRDGIVLATFMRCAGESTYTLSSDNR